MVRTGLVATVLGILGGFLGVWLGLTFLGSSIDGGEDLHHVIHERLVLSPRQEEAIAALEADFSVQQAVDEARMSIARRALAEALLRDQALTADVTRAAADIHGVMGELQLTTLSHVLAMRAELDVSQRAEFDRYLAQAFDVAD
tara:strand:+ start:146 stop:577 length:432 start_codon:yes stop_codon:yes gene_type:complete